MTSHPCAGHFCDGCATCRAGRCCLTVRDSVATTTADPDEILRQAILAERHGTVNLADLIRVEAVSGGRSGSHSPLLLPAPAPAPPMASPSTTEREEERHERQLARAPRRQ